MKVKSLVTICKFHYFRLWEFFKKILKKLNGLETRFYFNSRQKTIAIILMVTIAGILLFTTPAQATIMETIIDIVSAICFLLISVIGKLLGIIINLLISVAKYNNFIYEQPVLIGWKLVRDICNMFFVVILIIIAFSTVLGIQSFNYRNVLRKLVIMALLINFSKTISGFIIDFSQVVMLAFVNAFRDAGYNFTKILGLDELLRFAQTTSNQQIDQYDILGAMVAGLILVIVATVVTVIFLFILIVRVVYLWLLVILSPVAYILSALPGKGQNYASQWWDDFTKQIVIGPLLAFFLWLTLATAQVSGGKVMMSGVGYDEGVNPIGDQLVTEQQAASANYFPAEAVQPPNLLSFFIAICLLMTGLFMAQQVGGVAGSIAGKGLAKLRSTGTGLLTGKVGPSPIRWARQRYEAFQGRREAAKKERVGAFADRFYGTYRQTIGAPKAALRAEISAVRRTRAGEEIERVIKAGGKAVGAFGTLALGPAGVRRSLLRQHKAGVQEAHEKAFDASDRKENTIKRGVEGEGTFEYEKTARGDVEVRRIEDVAGREVKEKDILKITKFGNDFREAFNAFQAPANALKNKAGEQRVSKKMEDLEGLSAPELRKLSIDASAARDERRAASIVLAIKDGFNSREQLQQGKNNLSDNALLLKKFNEMADKRLGMWNNPPEEFKNKVSSGIIDPEKLSTKQLNRANSEFLADTLGIKFGDTIDKMIRTDVDRSNVTAALGDGIESRGVKDRDLKIRQSYARTSGDMIKAFTGPSGLDNQAMIDTLSRAKPQHLARVRKDQILGDRNFQTNLLQSISLSQLKGLENTGETDALVNYLTAIKQSKAINPKAYEDLIGKLKDDKRLWSVFERIP